MALLDLATGKETEIARGEQPTPMSVQWDPAGDRMSFFLRKPDPAGRESYVLTVYSLAAGKTIAERALTDREQAAYMYSRVWMPGGRSILALDGDGRCLRMLGPDLQETGRIDLPARIREPHGLEVVGNQVLVEDWAAKSLWRFNLERNRWARIR